MKSADHNTVCGGVRRRAVAQAHMKASSNSFRYIYICLNQPLPSHLARVSVRFQVFVLTDVKSRGLRFKQKKTGFIYSDAFHTKMIFPDLLGKMLFLATACKKSTDRKVDSGNCNCAPLSKPFVDQTKNNRKNKGQLV